jgi:hypothetical protein
VHVGADYVNQQRRAISRRKDHMYQQPCKCVGYFYRTLRALFPLSLFLPPACAGGYVLLPPAAAGAYLNLALS